MSLTLQTQRNYAVCVCSESRAACELICTLVSVRPATAEHTENNAQSKQMSGREGDGCDATCMIFWEHKKYFSSRLPHSPSWAYNHSDRGRSTGENVQNLIWMYFRGCHKT